MGSFKYFFLILCCFSPILDVVFGGITEGAQYMTKAAIATAVNAALFGIFYITRDRWGKWINTEYHRILGNPKEGEQEPMDSLMIILMGVDWLIFACLVPYGIYKEATIDSNWLLLVAFFAAMLWAELYQMRLHLVLSGSSKEVIKLSRIPFITIGVAIWGYMNRQTFESINALIVLVVGVFLAELFVDMAVRVVRGRVLKITGPEPTQKVQSPRKPQNTQRVQRVYKNQKTQSWQKSSKSKKQGKKRKK